jgi:dihydrofolate reductase
MKETRKIIVQIATSADGFIARGDGAVDWLDRPTPKGGYGMNAFYKSIDTILWGRKTCDMALEFVRKGVSQSAFDTGVKNYVFSRGVKPAEVPAAVEFVNEPVKEFAQRLRKQKGKNIWMMGGASLIASFLDAGEIDEFLMHVMPVFIGEGIPLMAAARRSAELRMLSCKKYPDGVLGLHYAVRK